MLSACGWVACQCWLAGWLARWLSPVVVVVKAEQGGGEETHHVWAGPSVEVVMHLLKKPVKVQAKRVIGVGVVLAKLWDILPRKSKPLGGIRRSEGLLA